jgi:type IV pilus assembly protein PilB
VASRKKRPPYEFAKLGFISDDEITNFLSQQYRVPTIDLTNYVIEPAILAVVSRDVCTRHLIIPISRTGRALIVAMADPTNLSAIEELTTSTGYNIEPVVATEAAILAAIGRYYGGASGAT